MAGGLTDYAEQQALQALLPDATSRWVGLFTTLPDDAGAGGVEASGGGYARVEQSAWTTEADAPRTVRKNNGAVNFGELTGAIGTVVGWGIFDAESGGNLLAFGEILTAGGEATTQALGAGDEPRILSGELKVGVD